MKDAELLARELYELAASVGNVDHLRASLGHRTVSVQASNVEQDRSIELQLLEDGGDSIEFAVFSDGPAGVLGMVGTATQEGVRLGSPCEFVDGVAVRVVDLSRERGSI